MQTPVYNRSIPDDLLVTVLTSIYVHYRCSTVRVGAIGIYCCFLHDGFITVSLCRCTGSHLLLEVC